jgi:hypothetical protein
MLMRSVERTVGDKQVDRRPGTSRGFSARSVVQALQGLSAVRGFERISSHVKRTKCLCSNKYCPILLRQESEPKPMGGTRRGSRPLALNEACTRFFIFSRLDGVGGERSFRRMESVAASTFLLQFRRQLM